MSLSNRATIWLRIESQASFVLSRHRQEALEFTVSTEPQVTARLHAVNTQPEATDSGDTILTVVAQHSLPVDWIAVLDGITREEWPEGFVPQQPNDFLIDQYPPGLRDFAERESAALRARVQDVLGLILWRKAGWIQDDSTLRCGEVEWSLDRETWHRLRLRPQVWAQLRGALTLQPEVGTELETVAQTTGSQPLGRDIWRHSLRTDPTTAIVLCVMAVEVETKRLIVDLAPDAAWLVREVPSPPVVRMLTEYLPKLSTAAASQPLPAEVIADLVIAVKIRNDLTHRGPKAERWTTTEFRPARHVRTTEVSSDILWLLDYYRGHGWALDNLTDGTRRIVDPEWDDEPDVRSKRRV